MRVSRVRQAKAQGLAREGRRPGGAAPSERPTRRRAGMGGAGGPHLSPALAAAQALSDDDGAALVGGAESASSGRFDQGVSGRRRPL